MTQPSDDGPEISLDEPRAPGLATERRPDELDHAEAGNALLPERETALLQGRWSEIQARFVDQPREAVGDADALVAELMTALSGLFTHRRSVLEQQWQRGESADTEQLRVAFKQYRAFFDRLLAA